MIDKFKTFAIKNAKFLSFFADWVIIAILVCTIGPPTLFSIGMLAIIGVICVMYFKSLIDYHHGLTQALIKGKSLVKIEKDRKILEDFWEADITPRED